MVTPLVDVLFNMMIAMFMFLMVYMAVALPTRPTLLRFPALDLPPAAPFVPFTSNIKVTEGSGEYLFVFGNADGTPRQIARDAAGRLTGPDALSMENVGELRLDPTAGTMRGEFLPASVGDVRVPVVVVDRQTRTSCTDANAEQWGQVRLFFHEERVLTAQVESLAREQQAVDAVPCFVAIRAAFTIAVRPHALPYTITALRPTMPQELCLTSGQQAVGAVAAIGGLEPYEFRKMNGPSWLTVNPGTGALGGSAVASGEFAVEMEVKDAQIAAGDWAAAARQQNIPTRPEHRGTFRVSVRPALEFSQLTLPAYGRVGEPVDGAVVVSGGCGEKVFGAQLPDGLRIDPITGIISGIPVAAGDYDIRVTVRDGESEVSGGRRPWPVVPPRPPRQVGGAPR
jgi:hypothetical protein